MEAFFSILTIALSSVIVSNILKKEGIGWSYYISIAGGCIILIILMPYIQEMISSITDIGGRIENGSMWLNPALKITGVAFLGEWGVELCKDANENALAYKLETGTKIVILILCIPIIKELLNLISSLLGGVQTG